MVRLVHGAPCPLLKVPRVIGLDEWTWRRGRRFGTILCDLERHQVVDLLPERSASSVAQWLQAHPRVAIVCRDQSGLYAEGIRQGALQALQVVDRFHLVQNLRDALESHPLPRICDAGGTPAVGMLNSSGGSWWPRGSDRRGGRWSDTSANCGGRQGSGANFAKWRLRPSMRRTMTSAAPPP
jgi:hypothetical protein